jgi:DNA-binding transcriptional LysR family regulator
MDRFTEMEVFVHTAELGTMSKAAETLGISNAAVSRHLVSLESRLNVRLVERNTRRLSLTAAGQEFYTRCKTLLNDLGEAETMVNATVVEPSGILTITASISFSMMYIAPLIPEFRRRYPRIEVKIVGENRYYDIIDSGIDLAIRTREFEADSNITVRKLAETRRVLAASPKYLKHRKTPKIAGELADHDLLIYSLANHPNTMEFTKDDETVSVKVSPMLESNDGQIIRAAALAGAGILIQPKYLIYEDLVAGRLIPVLDDWRLPTLTINLAFQERRYMPTKTRLFINFLIEHFKKNEYERFWMR